LQAKRLAWVELLASTTNFLTAKSRTSYIAIWIPLPFFAFGLWPSGLEGKTQPPGRAARAARRPGRGIADRALAWEHMPQALALAGPGPGRQ